MALPATEYLPLLNGITEKTEKGTEALQRILGKANTPKPDRTTPDDLRNGPGDRIIWEEENSDGGVIGHYKNCTFFLMGNDFETAFVFVYNKHLNFAQAQDARPDVSINTKDAPEFEEWRRQMPGSLRHQQKIVHELTELQTLRSLRSVFGEIE